MEDIQKLDFLLQFLNVSPYPKELRDFPAVLLECDLQRLLNDLCRRGLVDVQTFKQDDNAETPAYTITQRGRDLTRNGGLMSKQQKNTRLKHIAMSKLEKDEWYIDWLIRVRWWPFALSVISLVLSIIAIYLQSQSGK